MTKPPRLLHLRYLGRCDYLSTWQAMQQFTATRTLDSVDELWLLEHPPVFTLGQAGNLEHVRHAGEIPVIRTDRGGQVTYHGPGQLVCYLLFDLRRAGFGVRQVVQLLEQAVILLLAELGITADRREQAPGVYVNGAKIAALGLRIRRGCSYHGLALNLSMDLMPFTHINPCGYSDLQVTQLSNCGVIYQRSIIEQRLSELLAELLGLQLLNCN